MLASSVRRSRTLQLQASNSWGARSSFSRAPPRKTSLQKQSLSHRCFNDFKTPRPTKHETRILNPSRTDRRHLNKQARKVHVPLCAVTAPAEKVEGLPTVIPASLVRSETCIIPHTAAVLLCSFPHIAQFADSRRSLEAWERRRAALKWSGRKRLRGWRLEEQGTCTGPGSVDRSRVHGAAGWADPGSGTTGWSYLRAEEEEFTRRKGDFQSLKEQFDTLCPHGLKRDTLPPQMPSTDPGPQIPHSAAPPVASRGASGGSAPIHSRVNVSDIYSRNKRVYSKHTYIHTHLFSYHNPNTKTTFWVSKIYFSCLSANIH